MASKKIFVIQVEDRKTGEVLGFDIPARNVQEAEKRASEAGWIVIDPSGDFGTKVEVSPEVAAIKQQERAVTIGVLKAIAIAVTAIVVLIVIGNLVIAAANS